MGLSPVAYRIAPVIAFVFCQISRGMIHPFPTDSTRAHPIARKANPFVQLRQKSGSESIGQRYRFIPSYCGIETCCGLAARKLTPGPDEGVDPYFGLMEDPSNLCGNRKQEGMLDWNETGGCEARNRNQGLGPEGEAW